MLFNLKLLQAHRAAGQCHLSLLLLLLLNFVPGLLLLPLLTGSAAAQKVVTQLPGFDGPLPFYLETGYVGVDEEETGTELFYYFVESERSPATDPVILWLTGGPRCSVFSGLAFEVGPLKYVLEPYIGGVGLPKLVHNPLSWTKMASILFLDSPVGSGFSYARDPKGYDVGDYSSSLQVQRFLNKWFTDHPKYLSNPFYLGGDSYAGMVIPLIAQNISEGIEKMQQPLINLKHEGTIRDVLGVAAAVLPGYRLPAHDVAPVREHQQAEQRRAPPDDDGPRATCTWLEGGVDLSRYADGEPAV